MVSAPVLGFDLTRHPNGARLAGLLLRAIEVDSAALGRAAVAAGLPATRDELEHTRGEVLAVDAGRLDLEPTPDDTAPLAAMATSLVRRLVLRVDDVCGLVCGDVLGWATADPRATGLTADLIDAVTAWWTRPADHPGGLRLTAAYRAGLGAEPLPVATTPRVQEFLAAFADLSSTDRRAWAQRALTGGRATGAWAAAMHEASWAVVTTDRIRAAAVHQLLAVELWERSGWTAADAAEGLWNVVSGWVQALTVADVLADDPRRLLTAGGPLL